MNAVPERLDVGLVRRGLVRSRTLAQRLISVGAVTVAGDVVNRPSTKIGRDAVLGVDDSHARFVSRGGDKLDAALDAFGVVVAGKTAVDIGSSTGGFTDCLVKRGAVAVLSLDVGTGQLADSLRRDDRVTCMERTDVRAVEPADVGAPFDIVAVDVSFVSLQAVFESIVGFGAGHTDFLVLVKPQFEVGRSRLGHSGVVRDATVRKRVLADIVERASSEGLNLAGAIQSPIRGGSGNIEFMVHVSSSPPTACLLIDSAVR